MSNPFSPERRLKVIIAGGSIAGLTLAHCLERLGIDYLILEGYRSIAPQVGASIGILPNGARILDQLGCFDDIFDLVEPLGRSSTWDAAGNLLTTSDYPKLLQQRNGYPIAFIDRQVVLQVLYEHLPDKSKVLAGKHVVDVKTSQDGAVVFCKDGSSYEGDVVAGADGIHSAVRSIMQKHMDSITPGLSAKDKAGISCEYNAVFGIAEPVEGLVPGDLHRCYSKHRSNLTIVGKNGRCYFFVFSKLPTRVWGDDIPKYKKGDEDEHIKSFLDMTVTDKITFDKIWENRIHSAFLPLEESVNDHWAHDRFVCLGDSIHKMTPNMGAGGNAAMESAAALANSLEKIANKVPTFGLVEKALAEFHSNRNFRANSTCKAANELTRIEALATIPDTIMGLYVIPNLGDFLADATCDALVGAETLHCVPNPPRAMKATMPWNPEMGVGKHESRLLRALYALPLLAAAYGCSKTMGPALAQIMPLIKLGAQSGMAVTNYYSIPWLDKLLTLLVTVFTPTLAGVDTAHRAQMITFLGDIAPLQAIFAIESLRRGNFVTAAHLLPTVFGLIGQLKGIGYAAPIYFFLHYIQCPQEKYHAADNRLTQMNYAKTVVPAVVGAYVLPTIAMLAAPGLATRQWINGFFWQPFPIYMSIAHRLLANHAVTDTTPEDRMNNPTADMPYLRLAYRTTAVVSAAAYLYSNFSSGQSTLRTLFTGLTSPYDAVSIASGVSHAMKFDQIAAFGAGAYWVMLNFGDLKRAGKLSTPWWKIVGTFAATTLFAGPGAAMAVMWSWREEAMAYREVIAEKK